MKPISLRLAVLLAGLAFVLFINAPAPVQADEWNRETKFTADHDIEVPGAVLQANTTYVIRLMDSPAERKVVHVFNADQSELITTFMAVNAERLDPVEDTTFEFMEVPAGYPVPVQTWFYPGRRIGLEFLYSDDDRDKFASYRERTVQTEQVAQIEQPTPGTEENQIDLLDSEPQVDEPELAAVQQDEPVIDDSSVVDDSAPAVDDSGADMNEQYQEIDELPRTAGLLQLLGLMGVAATGMAAGVRLIRRS